MNHLSFNEREDTGVKRIFLHHVLNWNPKWIQDKKYTQTLPDVINEVDMDPAILKYSSTEAYQNAMLPVLIHEFWHYLKKNSRRFSRAKRHPPTLATKLNTIPKISSGVGGNDYKIYSSQVIAKTRSYNYPKVGDLIKIGIQSKRNFGIFAYVNDVAGQNVQDLSSLKYTLLTTVHPDDFMFPEFSLKTVTFLPIYLDLVEALQYLPKYPLYRAIISPNVKSYKIPRMIIGPTRAVTGQNLNAMQSNALAGILQNISQDAPKISLIHGPPGTGKVKTIVNLVASIINNNNDTKILICAPSNKAVDALLLELFEVKSYLKERGTPLHIIRVGNEARMHKSVKKIGLYKQAFQERAGKNKSIHEVKQDILMYTNVIASTLSSCHLNKAMKCLFGVGPQAPSSIPICIVDTAGQANEMQTLIPFLLGVKQLILVGDPQQLPPIFISKKARDSGYAHSLFGRVQKIFKDEKNNPIVMLDTQYRMVDTIYKWPNAYFYNEAMKSSAVVNRLGICDYKLFNHNYEPNKDNHTNIQEVELVAKLVELLKAKLSLKTNNNISIAVLTPFCKQRAFISNVLKPPEANGDRIIEVHTVDSFQGSERDIIILSLTESSATGFMTDPQRLCVGLTRAKYSLIIFGKFDNFIENPMWDSLINDAHDRGAFHNINCMDANSVIHKHVFMTE